MENLTFPFLYRHLFSSYYPFVTLFGRLNMCFSLTPSLSLAFSAPSTQVISCPYLIFILLLYSRHMSNA